MLVWVYCLYSRRYFPTIPVTAWRLIKSVVVNVGSTSVVSSTGFQRRCLKKSLWTTSLDFLK